jgi:hypothetical protein
MNPVDDSFIDDPAAALLTRSFVLGTARHPIPPGAAFAELTGEDGAMSNLAALALLGQRLRFRRHGPPPQYGATPRRDDPRKIVADAARPLMLRLVGGKDAADIAALALADTLERLSLRPHPFDLPRLPAFVAKHGERLGRYAAAWAERSESPETRSNEYFTAEAVDAASWTSARPAARVAFLAALREREPDRARDLLAATFANDPAPVRARLLGALQCGLSPADAAFLEGLAKDRAPSVRERAQQLLKHIPGTASAAARLRDLVDRIKRSPLGLMRRRTALTLELPANIQSAQSADAALDAARCWAADEYVGLGLDAIAAALALTVADMIAAAADDAPLLALFARQATIERRFDVLALIVREHAADAWIDSIATDAGNSEVTALPDDTTIERWCAAALVPELWPALPAAAQLGRLYTFLRGSLPLDQARALLQSRAFASIADAANSSPGAPAVLCLALAALVPAALRAQLRAAFSSLPPDETLRATLLLDCLSLLDPSSS